MRVFGNVIGKFSRVFVKLLAKKDIKNNRTRRKYADIRVIKMNRWKTHYGIDFNSRKKAINMPCKTCTNKCITFLLLLFRCADLVIKAVLMSASGSVRI